MTAPDPFATEWFWNTPRPFAVSMVMSMLGRPVSLCRQSSSLSMFSTTFGLITVSRISCGSSKSFAVR